MKRFLRGLALAMPLAAGPQEPGPPDGTAAPVLAELVESLDAEVPEPAPAELDPAERSFGIPFTAVELRGARVLATAGTDEARRAARALDASRALFQTLAGGDAFHPSGLRAFLLGTDDARALFLAKHPRVGPELRERLQRLEGAGVPGTADWAVWGRDAEARLDAIVRLSLDWLCRARGVTTERHAWLHEGLGFHLTHALVGTRRLWFVRPALGSAQRDGENLGLFARMEEPGADWLLLADGLFAETQRFDLEELLHLAPAELDPKDHLRVHALIAWIVAEHRDALPDLIGRVGADEDPRAVLQDVLGTPFGELRGVLGAWIGARAEARSRALGLRGDAELRAQWEALAPAQERAFVAAWRRRVDGLDTAQLRRMRAVLADAPAALPRAGELPFFDPKTHAPADPIPRKRLPAGDTRVKRLLKELAPEPDPRAPVLAHDYDWGAARVVRTGNPDDPEDAFENALLGVPPGADLARALVLAALDRADERALQAAFSHAYTDRDGRVYPVSLFDVWVTGTTMEMPDVDTLGIVHTVLDEWRRWTAPVPATQHAALYRTIGELFVSCRRSRELRLTLAELFLQPAPPLRDGYESLAPNLHALWAEHDSDPARLAAALPDGAGYGAFLAALVRRCEEDSALFARGRRRAAELRADQEALRAALGAALDEAEATPAAPSAPVPGAPGGAGGR